METMPLLVEIPRSKTKTRGFSTSVLGATRSSICSWKNVIWHLISNPTPFQARHENFYESFLLHLVSTTNMKIDSFSNATKKCAINQKQPSRCVLRKMCFENMHAANFIHRTPMPNSNLLNSHFDMGLLKRTKIFSVELSLQLEIAF